MFQGFFAKKFLDDFGTITSCFMNCYKIYIYRDNIRRYHCIVQEKNNLPHLFQPETGTFIGITLEDTIALHKKR